MAETVLVVDDEEDVRILIRFEMEAEGYDVVEATTGVEAIEIATGGDVDIMLLDLSMPDLDGFAVLDALRARGLIPSLRVIVVSAHADQVRARRAADAGAAGYLYKPFSVAELWAAVRSDLSPDS